MFSGLSPQRTNIEEANKHLQLLYTRVTELEKQLEHQQNQFESQTHQVEERIQKVALSKDSEISDLKQRLDIAESELRLTKSALKEKDAVVNSLELKAKRYDELSGYSQMITSMLALLSAPTSHTKTGSGLSNGKSGVNAALATGTEHPQQSNPMLKSGERSSMSGEGSQKHYAKPQLDTSPSIQQMARRFSSNRNFSISDDELDDGLPGDVFSKMKSDKECYL